MPQTVKDPPAMQETQVRSLYWEDPLEEGKATHSSILAWRIPMDRGTWWATVRGVANMTKQLSTAQQSFKIKKSLLKYSLYTVCSNCIYVQYIQYAQTTAQLHSSHILVK